MSGPKYTSYRVERQRLLAIKAQLEAEIERDKCTQLSVSIGKCIEKSDDFIASINFDRYNKIIAASTEVIKDSEVLKQLQNIISELKSEISRSYKLKGNSKTLTKSLFYYEERLKKIKNIVSLINSLLRDLNRQYNDQMQENLMTEFENTEWDTYAPISSISQTLMDVYMNIIEQLTDCENFEKEKAKYDAIMNNHAFDDQFKISQMKMKFDSYLVEKQSDSDNMEILNLRSQYVVLSNLIYGHCEKVPDDIDILNKEMKNMLEHLERQKVGEYVAVCVDKVMKELGYNIVGSEVLEAQKMTKQHYDFSDNSAITVAASENGAMMLEVVGKKNEDGTNSSASAVRDDMERFCPDYQKVKEGLQQYGVELHDKKLYPPEEKYVRYVDIKRTATADRRITAKNRKKRLYNE